MAQDKKKKKTPKVTMTADMENNVVNVTYGRAIKTMNQKDRQMFLNITLAGVDSSLKKLIGGLPMLRPATDEERESKIYVMVNGDADKNLYQGREQLYRTIADVMENTLKELFPDVIYVDECRQYQQETVFDMSSEEAEEYQKEIEEVTEAVKAKVLSEGKGESDDESRIN